MIFEFGQRLRELRKSRRWTQQQLADKLALSKATISAYECNSKTPSAEIIKAMALVFRVSADDLLGIKRPCDVHINHLTTEQKQLLELLSNEFRRLNR